MDIRVDVTKRFSKYQSGIEKNESIAAILRKQMSQKVNKDFLPKNYFFLKQLCNPQQTYWSYISPETLKSPELARKLNFGSQWHLIANGWFELLPNFKFQEGKVDGIFAGVPGVRGSIDFYIGDSIFEFKTKYKIPENVEEIFESYIQDLEQLCFYSVIHPENPKVNYLVFMSEFSPHDFRIFKVTINDVGKIKTLLISRIEKLREAIEKKDPSRLGKCRYYERRCQFHEKGICSCENLEPLPNDIIKKSIDISFDESLTKQINEIKENKKLPKDIFLVYNIIASRKYLGEKLEKLEKSEFDEGQKPEYTALLNSLIKESKLSLDLSKKQEIKDLICDERLYIPFKWINYRSSMKPDGEAVPYVLKVSKAKTSKYISNPSDYAVAELGIICSAYKKSKGLIITIYPSLDDLIQVFEVKFNKTEEILKDVKEIMDNLENIKTEMQMLPPCPDFMNDEKTCSLMKECHAEGGVGCYPGYTPIKHSPPPLSNTQSESIQTQ